MALEAHIHPGAITVNWQSHTLQLLPEKAIFWPEKEALLVADLHLGKSGHFQSHGIPIPGDVLYKDLTNLGTLINKLNPQHLIILGDLFHSQYNVEWTICETFFQDLLSNALKPLKITLLLGNHDILHRRHFLEAGFNLTHSLETEGICMQHEPDDKVHLPLIYGHIHPGIRLIGRGRQKLSLPCFKLGEKDLIMPAFGQFTGLYNIQAVEGDEVYAIAEGQVIQVL
ncbi:MAG: ligase-associated DNA damage response endonuclease PdeM [Bacteroidota bacterium]